MFGKKKRRSAGGQDDAFQYRESLYDVVTDFLMDHPIVTGLASIVLSVSAGLATTVLLVFLRTAKVLP